MKLYWIRTCNGTFWEHGRTLEDALARQGLNISDVEAWGMAGK